MTDSQEAARPPAPPPTQSRTFHGRLGVALRRQDWVAVAVEVGVVVLGVVIGFQVTAWGQARSDAAKEQRYLRQLAADLRETERQIASADSLLVEPDRAGGQLWAAFYALEPPPADSVFAWRAVMARMRLVTPVLGTAEALLATGDLSLVRNDSLRSAITGYVESSRNRVRIQNERSEQWWDELQRLDAGLDPMESYFTAAENSDLLAIRGGGGSVTRGPGWKNFRDQLRNSGYPVPDTPRIRFPLNVEAFLSNREMVNAAWALVRAKANLKAARADMREDALALRHRVELHLVSEGVQSRR